MKKKVFKEKYKSKPEVEQSKPMVELKKEKKKKSDK